MYLFLYKIKKPLGVKDQENRKQEAMTTTISTTTIILKETTEKGK